MARSTSGVGEIKGYCTVSTECKMTFDPNERAKLFHALRTFGVGTKVTLKLSVYDEKKEKEEERTVKQNKYYHKLLDIICDHTGDLHLDMHRELKIKLLGRPYIFDNREVIEVPSTTGLTTKRFGEYLEKVFQFASEQFGLTLPEPNTYY